MEESYRSGDRLAQKNAKETFRKPVKSAKQLYNKLEQYCWNFRHAQILNLNLHSTTVDASAMNSTPVCRWIHNFLSNRRHFAKVCDHISRQLYLSTGTPQSCALFPLLYSLYTNDCTPRSQCAEDANNENESPKNQDLMPSPHLFPLRP